jgi:exopolysaccharide biosynthesis protein
MKIRSNSLLALFFLLIPLSLPTYCQNMIIEERVWQKELMPGINYSHTKRLTAKGPLQFHVLRIDLDNPKISIKPRIANNKLGSLERTSSIAIRNNSVAAVNGSFFEARKKLHLPVGLLMISGEVISSPLQERTVFGITRSGGVLFGIPRTKGKIVNLENNKSVQVWGINRPRKKDEVIIYTNEWGPMTGSNRFGKELVVGPSGRVVLITEGDSIIPDDGFVVSLHGWPKELANKTKVGDRISLIYDMDGSWKDLSDAITGGPLLIKDGTTVYKESLKSEKFKGGLLKPNSRTALGLTKNNILLLVVVDKRYPVSIGATYDELAAIMEELGSFNAVGLDGGHASTMYMDGRVVNFPQSVTEADVSNALAVMYEGWSYTSIPKVRYTYIYVYKPPSAKLVALLIKEGRILPSFYVPKSEDYGLWGLYDIYKRVIKPVIPAAPTPAILFRQPLLRS